MKSGEQKQAYGIQELYRPPNGEPIEVDIVTVHGLNGDAFKTWTSEKGDICWLTHPDFLPRYVKRARVLSWGYNANISSLTGRPTSSDRIMHHAHTLVAQLYGDRDLEDAKTRPIIFICHSLGGIIVKKALAYSASRNAPNVAHEQSIFTCTFGILFFGTPHHGSSKARLVSSLQKLASITIPKATGVQFESSLLSALEEDSETLQNITDQFAPLMSNFRVFFFWEQEKTDLKYTKDYVVEEKSAAPIVADTERSGVARDHRGMVKFESSSEQGFRTTVAALRRYCALAPDVIGVRWRRSNEILEEKRRDEALEMLRGVSSSLNGSLPAASETLSRVERMYSFQGRSKRNESKRLQDLTDSKDDTHSWLERPSPLEAV